jgi:cytochrome c biogenesis protein CcmG/thiol:disulfide interchange protein DsbE
MTFVRRLPQILAVTVVGALLALLVWDLAHSHAGKIARDVDAGEIVPAYNFSRPRIDTTGSLSLPSLRGKVVVVNFWQSYCEPCHTEARTLEAASNQWKGKGVVFLGVDEIDLVSAARKFMERYGITYPTVSDDGPLVGHYGVTGYPETFFIDRQGQVFPIHVGDVVGHIVGPATKKVLDQGIRQALNA